MRRPKQSPVDVPGFQQFPEHRQEPAVRDTTAHRFHEETVL